MFGRESMLAFVTSVIISLCLAAVVATTATAAVWPVDDFEAFTLGDNVNSAGYAGSGIITQNIGDAVNPTQYVQLDSTTTDVKGVSANTAYDNASGTVVGVVDYSYDGLGQRMEIKFMNDDFSAPTAWFRILNDGTVQARDTSGYLALATGTQNNHWYRIVTTMNVNAGDGSLTTFDAEVIDLATFATVGSLSGLNPFHDPTDVSVAQAKIVFDGVNGAGKVDNFGLIVPEPASASFALVGIICLLRRRCDKA